MAVKKLLRKHGTPDKFPFSVHDTPENVQELLAYLEKKAKRIYPNSTPEEIIDVLRRSGIMYEPIMEDLPEEEEYIDNRGPGRVEKEMSSEEQRDYDHNMFLEAISSKNIFEGHDAIEKLYDQTQYLEGESSELGLDYYLKFAEKFLLEDDIREAKKDMVRCRSKRQKSHANYQRNPWKIKKRRNIFIWLENYSSVQLSWA